METHEIPASEPELMAGSIGIRLIYQGDTLLYERKAAYFYLRLENSQTERENVTNGQLL